MTKVTNELLNQVSMEEDNWVEVECDGCGMLMGECPESEWPEKELVLCRTCTPDCCSTERLQQVDAVKYADVIAQRKNESIDELYGPEDDGHCPCGSYTCDGTCDSNIPF